MFIFIVSSPMSCNAKFAAYKIVSPKALNSPDNGARIPIFSIFFYELLVQETMYVYFEGDANIRPNKKEFVQEVVLSITCSNFELEGETADILKSIGMEEEAL